MIADEIDMTAHDPKSSDQRDIDEAFAAGKCAAYDDCGHDVPPEWCHSDAEKEAWRRGLSSGYEDVERLIESERGRIDSSKSA